jgi:hypothetical protein
MSRLVLLRGMWCFALFLTSTLHCYPHRLHASFLQNVPGRQPYRGGNSPSSRLEDRLSASIPGVGMRSTVAPTGTEEGMQLPSRHAAMQPHPLQENLLPCCAPGNISSVSADQERIAVGGKHSLDRESDQRRRRPRVTLQEPHLQSFSGTIACQPLTLAIRRRGLSGDYLPQAPTPEYPARLPSTGENSSGLFRQLITSVLRVVDLHSTFCLAPA